MQEQPSHWISCFLTSVVTVYLLKCLITTYLIFLQVIRVFFIFVNGAPWQTGKYIKGSAMTKRLKSTGVKYWVLWPWSQQNLVKSRVGNLWPAWTFDIARIRKCITQRNSMISGKFLALLIVFSPYKNRFPRLCKRVPRFWAKLTVLLLR